MFVDSCKRLRIMKGSEAIGLGMYPPQKQTPNLDFLFVLIKLLNN